MASHLGGCAPLTVAQLRSSAVPRGLLPGRVPRAREVQPRHPSGRQQTTQRRRAFLLRTCAAAQAHGPRSCLLLALRRTTRPARINGLLGNITRGGGPHSRGPLFQPDQLTACPDKHAACFSPRYDREISSGDGLHRRYRNVSNHLIIKILYQFY